MSTKKKLYLEYFLLGFVILWSGGFFTYQMFPNWPYVLLVLSSFVMLKRGLKLEPKYIIVIAVFALVAIFQAFIFYGPFTSVIQPTVRFLAIAMVAAIVRPNLNHVFIKIMAFFALVSLIFWFIDLTPIGHAILLNVGKRLPQFGADILTEINSERYETTNYSLYFYTVAEYKTAFVGFLNRNSGPFYEPGRFSIPLTIAMAMILYTGNYRKYKKYFLILLVASITTFSTTAYLTLITLYAGYYIGRSNANGQYKFVMFVVVIIAAYYLMGLSFMGDKIVGAMGDTDLADTRFGAMFYHLPQIFLSPWIGFGPFLGKVFEDLEMSPCGITDMMRIWGIPMFIVCLVLLYKGMPSYMENKKAFRVFFLMILLFMAYTQTIMSEPLYYLLYFIGGKKEGECYEIKRC